MGGEHFQGAIRKDIFIRAVDRRIRAAGSGIFSINGIATKRMRVLCNHLRQHAVIYVTADQRLRWERSQRRGEKSMTRWIFETFCRLESTLTETEKLSVK